MDAKFKGALEGNLSGSASGAAAGAAFGPYGAIIGGAIGGTVGGFTGWFKAKGQEEAAKKKRQAWEKAQKLLLEAQQRANAQRAQIAQSAFGPVNNNMMSMYGPQANMMPASQYAPRAKKAGE